MSSTMVTTSLWMGDILPDMDENSIINAFAQAGEVVVRVKIMASGKYTNSGHLGRYCFVEFTDYESAHRALHRLNGTIIPGMPGRRFKLNTSNRDTQTSTQFSLYVGLSDTVNDSALLAFFQKRYPSVHSAKVILDSSGKSKGFGFVRFGDEKEQQKALIEMQHMTGLGNYPIKVSLATAKKPDSSNTVYGQTSTTSYQYYPDHQSWGDYNYQYNQHSHHEITSQHDEKQAANVNEEEDPEALEDPGLEINIGKENREFIDSSEAFFTALEMSRWLPLDNIMSEIPD